MHHTLLISKNKTLARYALLDKSKLPIEFGIDYATQKNSIYAGRVLDVKPAFGMVFFDLTPYFDQPGLFSTTTTHAKKFQTGKTYLIQVRFAPLPVKGHSFLRTKGPKVTPELRFSCPYFIYFPKNPGIFFSKRLDKKKIEPFLPTLKSLLSNQEGLILRPLYEQVSSLLSLKTYLKDIQEKAQTILNKEESTFSKACLYKASSSLFQKIEEIGFSLSTIIVDNKFLYADIKDFMQNYQLSCEVKLKLNNPLQESLFESFSLEEKWEESLSPFVPLPAGGNLIIEKTEGFWAVDVNSQGREGISSARSPKALNEEAAKTLFHTIRLRNLGGKIIIDFLPLPQKEDFQDFYHFLKKLASYDPISLKISCFTQTGLCELTREKTENSLLESVQSL